MKDKKKGIIFFGILSIALVALFTTSYALFQKTVSGTKNFKLSVGTLDFELEQEKNSIRLNNAFPMSDSYGKTLNPYTFSLHNTGDGTVYYRISLEEDTEQKQACSGCEFLSNTMLRYELKEGETAVGGPELLSEVNNVLATGSIEGGATKNFELRLWLKEEATIEEENKYYFSRIKIEGSIGEFSEEYVDPSGASAPVLATGMIPVTYDEGQESWVKADTSSAWYDYNNQMWANAVTVTEANRSTYMSASAGTPIPMTDINTMWVWIPRYEYQYTDLGDQYAGGTLALPGEIKVNFIPASQISPSNPDVYKIPEGFTFGDEVLSGFWIGKFETTGSMSAACTDENCTTADLTIKPNLTAVTNQSIGSLFFSIRSMQNEANASKYGFDVIGSGTTNVHMAKSTEWGLVAMLSQSKYGKYGNPSYSGADKEVAINNCSNLITGIGGETVSASESTTTCTTNTYETLKGQAASTTGTIYGVYDMSGGAYEYVMGVHKDIKVSLGSSNNILVTPLLNFDNQVNIIPLAPEPPVGNPYGFEADWYTQKDNAKYYDLYKSDILATSYYSGDAIYETNGWYRDKGVYFVTETYPWLSRGGWYTGGYDKGIFMFYRATGYGNGSDFHSARCVMKS